MPQDVPRKGTEASEVVLLLPQRTQTAKKPKHVSESQRNDTGDEKRRRRGGGGRLGEERRRG